LEVAKMIANTSAQEGSKRPIDMSYYEDDIEKLERRIRKLDENPDPTKLRSNRMLYELQIEALQDQIEACRRGSSIGGWTIVPKYLAQAIGLTHNLGTGFSVWRMENSERYLEVARAKGIPADSSCDMNYLRLAMREVGTLPQIDWDICLSNQCTSQWAATLYTAHTGDRKDSWTYYLDAGYDMTPANLQHVVDQLHEIIEIVEKNFPGTKYNEDRLIELQTLDEECRGYFQDQYRALAHRPSPIGGHDSAALSQGVFMLPMTRKTVEWARARRDEVLERVDKGIAAVPGEKLRILWTVTRPTFFDPYAVLSKWKIVVPFAFGGASYWTIPGFGSPPWDDSKLTPLEKEAAALISITWTGEGKRWVDGIRQVCQDLQIDAIINYLMLGCTATLGLQKVVKDMAENELGIPTLQLEGKQLDATYASEATISAKLDEFAQICLTNRGLA
jgi:benzoyl-CoA reductase/2-hydroxyglutaryl-CoA dehydratase subunit BcrC/BadD/HgdB